MTGVFGGIPTRGASKGVSPFEHFTLTLNRPTYAPR